MRLESRVIQALKDAGFPLISDYDARTHRSPYIAQSVKQEEPDYTPM